MKPARGAGGLVYSTDAGRMCPVCRQAVTACTCRKTAKAIPAGDGIVRVSRETGGRGGKTVTVVRGVPLDAPALVALAASLKAACGCGGTVKDGVIELQGDRRDPVVAHLEKAGWRVRRAGG